MHGPAQVARAELRPALAVDRVAHDAVLPSRERHELHEAEHLLRAAVAHADVAARHGHVRLGRLHADDARRLAADGRLGRFGSAARVEGCLRERHYCGWQ